MPLDRHTGTQTRLSGLKELSTEDVSERHVLEVGVCVSIQNGNEWYPR